MSAAGWPLFASTPPSSLFKGAREIAPRPRLGGQAGIMGRRYEERRAVSWSQRGLG